MRIRKVLIITNEDSELSGELSEFDLAAGPSEFSGNVIIRKSVLSASLIKQIEMETGWPAWSDAIKKVEQK